ncbi:MAG TPA: VWA domain-containing protein [Rudaea sp.]|jgi:Ca-activated chloride channel family protein|uniref:VWA domain-containing protein n=1 Tax=Rudaea sp. TaxID=2136325 RepID=UPI002F91CD62
MSGILQNFHFFRPWWLLALLALSLLWRALRWHGADADVWRGAVDAHLLEHLLVRNEGSTPVRSPRWLLAAVWALACIALAGPAWERLPQPLFQNKAARVIAFELGNSMLAQDVKPSRFERARYKIADILKRSGDAQTALIAYAGDAFVVAPLTDDSNTVVNLVDSLDPSVMPAAGNDTGRAIDLGVKLIRQAGLRDGEVVLLADDASANAAAAAARARAAGVRVSVLGVGTEQGAPVALAQGGFLKDDAGNIVLPKLDAAALAALARAGGGRYASFSGDASDLDAVLDTLKASDASVAASTQVQSERYLDRGPWLLLALLPLAALGFRRGWLMLLPLVLLAHANRAEASVWDDLWQRADQQAQAQLDAGRAKQAQALAANPDLRGAAAYRAGDYPAATQSFDRDNADAQYNRGNALAKQGQYNQALAAYGEALKRAPQMPDALANKQAVEEWLKKQQKDKSKQNQHGDSKDHKGDKQQQPGNDQAQNSEQNKDGKGDQQGKDDGDKQPSQQQGKDQQGQSPQDGKQQPSDSAKDADKSASGQNQSGDDKSAAKPPGAGSEAAKEAQRQFQQSMDQALGKNTDKDGNPNKTPAQPVRLGEREGDKRSEQGEAVEQWLQRVPDDPGGLLRRKFQLEYQRRQHGGAQEDSQ